ncbi:hypothetical protein OG474_41240 [Kribbella sp. NBC_01505]|uniref:type III PLP-dependent enzyme n=1 Tax=Kribbella sp. NBC_01505 TaxID=2903580 RepID=UPI003863DCF6
MSSPDELVQRFGTPLYVYRTAALRAAVDDLRASLPQPHRLYYSVKANPHPGVVRHFTSEGLRAEISSSGELAVALAAGQAGNQLLYTGPGKTFEEVVHAIRSGVRYFSVESVEDHRRLSRAATECAEQVHCIVRVNGTRSTARTGLRMTGRPSQFGIDVDTILSTPHLLAATANVRPAGLHFFPATNVTNPQALIGEFAESVELARQILDRMEMDALLLDLGGGFAAPFARPGERPRYHDLRGSLERLLDTSFEGWREGKPTVAFEAGRYLVAGAGTLLTSILDVKRSGDRTFVVLDAGINALGGMSSTGRLLPPAVLPADGDASDEVTLVGPLCTPLDVLSRAAQVPDLRVGGLVAVPNVGAYGLTASVVAFLSRQPPLEVLLDSDESVASVTTLSLQIVETRAAGRNASCR